MSAIVKPIEAKSVHQIQSGQVIVDLCSVVKELVENGLDAGANTIEVRFKNNGLDEIEVQDNGHGIAAVNYESVALKHHTSKLSTFDDLTTLHTFGFRGEALSSLCALSTFTITTAQAEEAPKGHRLEFEVSGKLKNTSIVACQKGTTATVQNLFEKLPVRRKELSKNIKREYGKVLGLLHAYACISTNVKFTVKNAMPKAKSVTIFSTKSNTTTRENIANIYGSKTLSALVALELDFDFPRSLTHPGRDEPDLTKVVVQGHISKPVFGEGRQTPDRQMFFVNGRPCGLPQIAKAINEVYKSFNVSQSPFILADFQMDTGAYDVNVSPDKRTIFLHNATALTEKLKDSLTELFDEQDHTVPQSYIQSSKLPAFKQLSLPRESSITSSARSSSAGLSESEQANKTQRELETVVDSDEERPNHLLHNHFNRLASTREPSNNQMTHDESQKRFEQRERRAAKIAKDLAQRDDVMYDNDEFDGAEENVQGSNDDLARAEILPPADIHVRDFNARMAEQQEHNRVRYEETGSGEAIPSETPIAALPPPQRSHSPGIVQSAFNRMKPKRLQPEVATITIGDRTVTRIIGTQPSQTDDYAVEDKSTYTKARTANAAKNKFAQGLERFSASETRSPLQDDHGLVGNIAADSDSDPDIDQHVRNSPSRTRSPEVTESRNQQVVGGTRYESQYAPQGTIEEPAEDGTDDTDENEHKAAENERVAELIRQAEDNTIDLSKQTRNRAVQALKSRHTKDAVYALVTEVDTDVDSVESSSTEYRKMVEVSQQKAHSELKALDDVVGTAEERLSLTVSKPDFLNMHVVGQFNLGFILAVRHKHTKLVDQGMQENDELFIIDQHASDEKYNFERLQAETIVGNQRMVRPATLDLTAVEEEIVIENMVALEKNGFVVEVDDSGDLEVGRRCRLVSLPVSKEVVFGSRDLDELIHLLTESPMLNESSAVPRPSKVRKMFAMRACRSSIMIGKTLSRKQMSAVLQHMGTIDKPWNCPHGRPTMRHLASLDTIDTCLWKEGDGLYSAEDQISSGSQSASEIWHNYAMKDEISSGL